jgi:AraC-like DNA-binding protein
MTHNNGTATAEFISKVNHLLDQHEADHRYTISDLARDMRMSRVQLHRKVKQLTGKCCSQHVRDRKLEKAYHLLKETNRSVTEVAYEVGFNNLSYFARKFREKFKQNPSQVTGYDGL